MTDQNAALAAQLLSMVEGVTGQPTGKTADECAGLSVLDDLGMDSLDFINFLFEIEETFGVKVPEEDIDAQGLTIFGKLAGYLEARR